VESGIARARALERSARAEQRSTVRGIVLEVSQSYWAVRAADLVHDLLEHALQRELDIEQSTKARVDAGIAPIVDYHRAHVLVLRQRTQIKSLIKERDAALAQLAAVLQIDEPIELVEEPPAVAPVLPELDALEREALAARPELLAASARLEAQTKAVRVAKSAYWPQLSLVGSATLQNRAFYQAPLAETLAQSAGPSRDERLVGNFFVGAQLRWTAFDMLTTWMNVQDAAYLRDRIEQDRIRLRHRVIADVRSAYQKLRHEAERLSLVEATSRAAREALESLRKRYRVGSAVIFELTAAEQELVAIETEMIAARVAIAQAQTELRAAYGKF
jgi:outer membrane protein TolC